MLSDSNAQWSEKLGLKKPGDSGQTQRYAIIIDDLVVKSIEVRWFNIMVSL